MHNINKVIGTGLLISTLTSCTGENYSSLRLTLEGVQGVPKTSVSPFDVAVLQARLTTRAGELWNCKAIGPEGTSLAKKTELEMSAASATEAIGTLSFEIGTTDKLYPNPSVKLFVTCSEPGGGKITAELTTEVTPYFKGTIFTIGSNTLKFDGKLFEPIPSNLVLTSSTTISIKVPHHGFVKQKVNEKTSSYFTPSNFYFVIQTKGDNQYISNHLDTELKEGDTFTTVTVNPLSLKKTFEEADKWTTTAPKYLAFYVGGLPGTELGAKAKVGASFELLLPINRQ